MLRLIMYHRRVISGGFRAASIFTRREGVRCTPRRQGGMRHVLSQFWCQELLTIPRFCNSTKCQIVEGARESGLNRAQCVSCVTL